MNAGANISVPDTRWDHRLQAFANSLGEAVGASEIGRCPIRKGEIEKETDRGRRPSRQLMTQMQHPGLMDVSRRELCHVAEGCLAFGVPHYLPIGRAHAGAC